MHGTKSFIKLNKSFEFYIWSKRLEYKIHMTTNVSDLKAKSTKNISSFVFFIIGFPQ